MASLYDIDPRAYGEGILDELDLPSTEKRETVPEVFDRVVELVEKAHDEPPRTGTAETFPPIEVTVEAAGGKVAITLVDTKVSSLRLDSYRTATSPVDEIERAVVEALNRALAESQEAAVAQLTAASTGIGTIFSNIRSLQADMHQAYINDLEKVTAPLKDL